MNLDGIQRQVLLEEQCGEVKYYLDEADVYHNALQRSSDVMFRKREEEELQAWEEVPALLRSAIAKVHRQYSHSLYKKNFSHHLRLAGASDRAIKAASLFSCPTCEKERRSLARPTAAVPNYTHFNQCVAIDIAHIPDQEDVMHSFLMMVDMATSYTLASYLCSGESPPDEPLKQVLIGKCPEAVSTDIHVALQSTWQREIVAASCGHFVGSHAEPKPR